MSLNLIKNIKSIFIIVFITIIMLIFVDFISYLIVKDDIENKNKPYVALNIELLFKKDDKLVKKYKDLTNHYFSYDATLGFRFKPNSELIALTGDKNGKPIVAENIKLHTDKYGFVSNDYKDIVYKPLSNVYTIIVTGGSTVAGWGASDNTKTWVAQLEKLINNQKVFFKNYQYVRVINAGVFGYRTAQELKRFQEELIYLKPNMLIMFNGINEPWTYYGNSVDYSTHSQQNKMMDFFNNYVDKNTFNIFMPYTQKLMQRSYEDKTEIYGYKNSELKLESVELYLSKIKQFEAICKVNSIKFLYYLQPIMGADNKLLSKREESLKSFFGSIYYKASWQSYINKLNTFYDKVEADIEMENNDNYKSLRYIFDGIDKTFYNDPRHYNDAGQLFIAHHLYKEIISKIRE